MECPPTLCQGSQELQASTDLSSVGKDGCEPISAAELSSSLEYTQGTVWVPESQNTSKGRDGIGRGIELYKQQRCSQ